MEAPNMQRERLEADRGCREAVVSAAREIVSDTGDNDFTPREIIAHLMAHGSRFQESTIRTHVFSRCCVDAPDHHAVRYRDFERMGRGRYRLMGR